MTNHLERQDGASSHGHADGAEAMRAAAMAGMKEALTFGAVGMAAGAVGEKLGKDGMLHFKNPFDDVADPFKQSGYDDSKGTFDKVWNGVKKLFGSEDKLDDQIKKYVEEKKLSPEEKKELQQEKKLYDEEMAKHKASYLQMNIAGKIYPPPDIDKDSRFGVMKKLDGLVKDEEQSIKKHVEDKMPGLMPEVKKQMEEYKDGFKIHNPAGTGEGFRSHDAGKHLEVYWEEVRKETERRAHKDN